MKEFGNREHHLDVPQILKSPTKEFAKGKVVVDIGLNDGLEFFAAMDSGYSVYGFEANPFTALALRKKCDEYDGKKHGALRCSFLDAANITNVLEPLPFHSYLIEGGAGSVRTTLNSESHSNHNCCAIHKDK